MNECRGQLGARSWHAPAMLSAVLACGGSAAAPMQFPEGCYLGHEPAASLSHLGVRRKSTQLFEIDLSVPGPNLATCSLNGVARLRVSAGEEVLAMVVRPDAGSPAGRGAGLCQLFLKEGPSAIDISTTEPACQAQLLCGGRVSLQGRRFELAGRLPAGSKGPCFGPAPR